MEEQASSTSHRCLPAAHGAVQAAPLPQGGYDENYRDANMRKPGEPGFIPPLAGRSGKTLEEMVADLPRTHGISMQCFAMRNVGVVFFWILLDFGPCEGRSQMLFRGAQKRLRMFELERSGLSIIRQWVKDRSPPGCSFWLLTQTFFLFPGSGFPPVFWPPRSCPP